MTNQDLEKATRAMWLAVQDETYGVPPTKLDELPGDEQERMRRIAAATLSSVLLDPSDEVVQAVSRALSRIGGDPTEGDWATWEPETRAALRAAGVKITGSQE